MDRNKLRDTLENLLDIPLSIIALVMLILIIIDLTTVVSPVWRLRLDIVYWFTWTVFLLEFVIKLLLSENKREYIRNNWISLAIILIPFLRILRILRIVALTRSIALLRLFLYGRIGLSGLGKVLSNRLLYLFAVTLVVVISGAIGCFILESGVPEADIKTFGDALWWSSCLVTTVSSNLFAVTSGGRVLGLALRIFGLGGFSYLAGSIAAFFIETERQAKL